MQSQGNTTRTFVDRDQQAEFLLAMERFELVAKATHDVIWDWDLVRNQVWWSSGMEHLFGYAMETVDSNPDFWYDRIHPDDRDRVVSHIHEAIDSDASNWSDVYRFVRADGTYAHVRDRSYTIKIDGKAVRMVGSMTDITEEVKSKEKVIFADQQASMTIEGSGAGSFLVDLASDEVIYSPAMARILTGREDSQITRSIFIDHVHPEDTEVRHDAYKEAIKTGMLRYEARFIWQDKSVHWIKVIGQYLYDVSGKAVSLSGIVMDITDRIESEQRLKKSEERYRKLANELERRVEQRTAELNQANAELVISNNNLQQFAYAASHDMQEPLRKIQSFGSRLQTVYAEVLDENGLFMLSRIQDASKRMTLMIDDLLAYSRLTTQEAEFRAISLDQIVASVLADLELYIQDNSGELSVAELGQVWGSPTQITQLLQNLISNAVKYRQQNLAPRVSISTRRVLPGEIPASIHLLDGHSYICLEVRDNGIGFEESHLDRMFQMFQRLHGRSEYAGSGIGLAICKKVVQNHLGYMTAKSEVGVGSTFLVYLPQPA